MTRAPGGPARSRDARTTLLLLLVMVAAAAAPGSLAAQWAARNAPLPNAAGVGWAQLGTPPAGAMYARRLSTVPVALALDVAPDHVTPHLQLRADMPSRMWHPELSQLLLVAHFSIGALYPLGDELRGLEVPRGHATIFGAGLQIWPTYSARLFADFSAGFVMWPYQTANLPFGMLPQMRFYLGWGW